jgi:predicted small lipoprotein YifL
MITHSAFQCCDLNKLLLLVAVFTVAACSPKSPAEAPPSRAAIADAALSGIPVQQSQPKLAKGEPWLHSELYPSGEFLLPDAVVYDFSNPIGRFPYIQPIVENFSGSPIGPNSGVVVTADNLAKEGEYFIIKDKLWTSPGRLYHVSFSQKVADDAYQALRQMLKSMGGVEVLASTRATFENHQVPLAQQPLWCRSYNCDSVLVYAFKRADVQIWVQWLSEEGKGGSVSVMQFGELPESANAPFVATPNAAQKNFSKIK